MRPRNIPTVSVSDADHDDHGRRHSTFNDHKSTEATIEEDEEIYDDSEDDRYDNGDEEDHDDEAEAPVWTFRVLYLGSLSCLFLYILNKYFLRQTAQCIMSMVTTVSILYPLGHIMAKLTPKRRVFLRTFGVEFSLNPGPFDTREFALISIFANSGAAYGGITSHSVHASF